MTQAAWWISPKSEGGHRRQINETRARQSTRANVGDIQRGWQPDPSPRSPLAKTAQAIAFLCMLWMGNASAQEVPIEVETPPQPNSFNNPFAVSRSPRGSRSQSSVPSLQRPVTHNALLPTRLVPGLAVRAKIEFPEVKYAGYVPLEITLTPTGTFKRDREFTLKIRQEKSSSTPSGNITQVEIPLQVQQGSGPMVFRRCVPRYTYGEAFQLELLESGQSIPASIIKVGNDVSIREDGVRRAVKTQDSPPVLMLKPIGSGWIAAPLPDGTDVQFQEFESESDSFVRRTLIQSRWLASVELGNPSNRYTSLQTWKQLDAARAPTDWRGYQSYGGVILDSSTLAQMQTEARESLDALRQWVLCGGTLVIMDCNDYEKSMDLLRLSSIPEPDTDRRKSSTNLADGATSAQWQMIRKSHEEMLKNLRKARQPTLANWLLLTDQWPANLDVQQTNSLADANARRGQQESRGDFSRVYVEALARDVDGKVIPLPEQSLASLEKFIAEYSRAVERFDGLPLPVIVRRGAGKIILSAESSRTSRLLGGSWQLAAIHLRGHFRSSVVRRGADPILGDARFYRWMIPGVAEPPVYSFIAMLFFFVLAVGPVAYFFTARSGRTHLMFAIAPAMALLTTVMLLTYGVIADGFDITARCRRITIVDGASGDAGQRTRTTYFAGIRPANGLEFPVDAEVVPYRRNDGVSWEERLSEQAGTPNLVQITEKAQKFGIGFLPSRDQRQFVVHQPVQDFGKLTLTLENETSELNASEGPESSVYASLINSMEPDLRDVVVRDASGMYWYAERVPSGQGNKSFITSCTPMKLSEASKKLGEILQTQRLVSSVSETSATRNAYGYVQRTRDVTLEVMQGTSNPTGRASGENGIFEHYLQELLLFGGELPPNHFVAIADVKPESLALPDANLVESIHYILGTLP